MKVVICVISILAGNLNSGRSYHITAVQKKQNSAAAHWAGKFKKRAERAVIRFLRDLAEIGSFSWKIKIMRPTQIQEHLVLVNLKNLPLL